MKAVTLFSFSVAALVLLAHGSPVTLRAQSEVAPCTSFTALTPDVGNPLAYTVPIAHGTFADVEIGSASSRTVQIDVEVVEQSAIRERRIFILVPGRVELLSDMLDVKSLFELGAPLLVRIEASEPISAVLVRR